VASILDYSSATSQATQQPPRPAPQQSPAPTITPRRVGKPLREGWGHEYFQTRDEHTLSRLAHKTAQETSDAIARLFSVIILVEVSRNYAGIAGTNGNDGT
jgi:hypothetical protein